MSNVTVNQALAEFKPDDYSVRLVQAVLAAVPGAPEYTHYTTVADAVAAIAPGSMAEQLAAGEALGNAQDPQLHEVLWMGRVLDTGDSGYAIYTGVRSALNFFFGDKSIGLENDVQQRNDAVLKAVGLSYMVWHAYPGSVAEKAETFKHSPAGQTLAAYYGAVEVALPFADNALVAGGSFLHSLFTEIGPAQLARLGSMAGGKSLDGAKQMLESVMQPLERVSVDLERVLQAWRAGVERGPAPVIPRPDGTGQVVGCGDSGIDLDSCYFWDPNTDITAGWTTDRSTGAQIYSSTAHRKVRRSEQL